MSANCLLYMPPNRKEGIEDGLSVVYFSSSLKNNVINKTCELEVKRLTRVVVVCGILGGFFVLHITYVF